MEELSRICVKNCEFMKIDGDKVSCDYFETQLELEKYSPEHYTFTVLKCDNCLEADVETREKDGIDKIQQLENELKFLNDYFYSFIIDFEEALTSTTAIVKTLRKDDSDV